MEYPWKTPIGELRERYLAVHTPAVADILDEHGRFDQVLPPEITPLRPEMKVAGPVFTAKGVSTRHFEESQVQEWFEGWAAALEVPERVALIDASGDRTASHWGELVTTAARAMGFTGSVVTGGVRDVDRILPTGFPVFATYSTPADIRGRWRYVDFGNPLHIGGVHVKTWDWVLGDMNGVVIVPVELVEEVLVAAEEVVRTEDLIRDELRAGGNPLEVYMKHGRF